jgi:tetratricopeptide (TPR) repeat protein
MWSRRSIEVLIGAALFAGLTACSVAPRRAAEHARTVTAAQGTVVGKSGTAGGAPQTGAGQGAQAAAPPPIPVAAKAEFDHALTLAAAGNQAAAEAQLAGLAHEYPQFCTPLVDLGILYRKSGNLDAAAYALQQAAERDPRSALAWTELGITERLGGKFQDAEQSYTRALAADPAYAPAYRDRGVLRDLYLDQPAAALGDFEQYRKLAAQDKPVVMWIAELQHRTGIKEPVAASVAAAPQPQARN